MGELTLNKELGLLYLDLKDTDRSKVANLLIDVGLCIEFKTPYRHHLSRAKSEAKGKLLKVLSIIYTFSKEELDRIAGLLLEYK